MSESDEYKPSIKRQKRKYVRRRTSSVMPKMNPALPNPQHQITELAFNIHGWALEDGMKGRGIYEVINANKATMLKGGFEAKIRELQAKGVSDIYRNDLNYSMRETDHNLYEADTNVIQYLVVGYTLQEDDPLFVPDKTFTRYSENEIVGEERPQPEHILKWSACRTPILVVTPVKVNIGQSVRLFGLILPRNGLCQPVLIQQERIFYRWEFRASSGSRPAQRNKIWNELVVRFASEKLPNRPPSATPALEKSRHPMTPSTPARQRRQKRKREILGSPSIKQESDSNDNDTASLMSSRSVAHETISHFFIDLDTIFSDASSTRELSAQVEVILTPEIFEIIKGMRATKSDRILADLQNALNSSTNSKDDLRHYPGLQAFISDDTFGVEDAEAAVTEISRLWADLKPDLSVDAILHIKLMMKDSNINVQFSKLYDLFKHILYMHQSDRWEEGQLGYFMQLIAHQNSTRSSPTNTGDMPPKRVAPDTIMMAALMKEVLQIHDWQGKMCERVALSDKPESFVDMEVRHSINLDYADACKAFHKNIDDLKASSGNDKSHNIEEILGWFKKLRAVVQRT